MDSVLSAQTKVSKKFGQGIFEDIDDIDVYDTSNSSMFYYSCKKTNKQTNKQKLIFSVSG